MAFLQQGLCEDERQSDTRKECKRKLYDKYLGVLITLQDKKRLLLYAQLRG